MATRGFRALKKKLACLGSPCSHLNPSQRLAFKILYGAFGHWIHPENEVWLDRVRYPAIFAFNHNNALETVLITLFFLERLRDQKVIFLTDWMYGVLPGAGRFLSLMDPIYVYTKTSRWAAVNRRKDPRPPAVLQAGLERLGRGCSLGIFPEGTRNPHPRKLRRGRRGIGVLALSAAVPVVPVGVEFPDRRPEGLVPGWGRMVLNIGAPLRFPREAAVWAAAGQELPLASRPRRHLEAYLAGRVTQVVMGELARLSGKDYPHPPPRFPAGAAEIVDRYTDKGDCYGADHDV